MIINTTINISIKMPEEDAKHIQKAIALINEQNVCNRISNGYIDLIKNRATEGERDGMGINVTTTIDWCDDHRLNRSDVGYDDYKDMFENNTVEYPEGICLCCKQVKHLDQMFQYIDGERYMCFDCY